MAYYTAYFVEWLACSKVILLRERAKRLNRRGRHEYERDSEREKVPSNVRDISKQLFETL